LVDRFFSNCREKGYSEEIYKGSLRQIESFAGYSFSKAHSASYAVESFQSLWLKAHYPLEFMVAVINNFGGFYRTWVYVHEAKRSGATIQLTCINKSRYKTTIYGTDIYLGFIHIMSLQDNLARSIEEIRGDGCFADLADFVTRVCPVLNRLFFSSGRSLRFTGKEQSYAPMGSPYDDDSRKQESYKTTISLQSGAFTAKA